MKPQTKYGIIGLAALKRAASRIAEEARRNNFKVPIWKDGQIEYGIPDAKPEQPVEGDSETGHARL